MKWNFDVMFARQDSRRAANLRGMLVMFAGAWLAMVWLTTTSGAAEEKERKSRKSRRTRAAADADNPSLATGVSARPADPAAASLKLKDAIAYAEESRKAVQEVKDYSAVFTKTELIGKKLHKQEMEMKFRTSPFSVYLRYRSRPNEGRQAIYVDGKFRNRLIVREANGLASLGGTQQLRLDDGLVMKENRHPVTDLGIANLVDTTIKDWEHDAKVAGDEVEVKFFPDARLGDLACQAIEVRHLKELRDLKYHMNRIYFDKQTKLPVRGERYGWPKRPGEEPPLLEDYKYQSLKTNVNLTDADFEPARYGL